MGRIKIYKTPEELKEAKKLARKKYVEKNKEKVYEQHRKWREKNPDKPREYVKNYRKENIEKVRDKINIWRNKNKDLIKKKHNEYRKKRKGVDPLYKLKCNVRTLISNSFKRLSSNKTSKTNLILGCSYEAFKEHLEQQFESWMNWDNHGLYNGELNYGWDIDHIIPLATAKCEEDLIKLNHYTNLQPLCGKINRDAKRDKINFELSMDF